MVKCDIDLSEYRIIYWSIEGGYDEATKLLQKVANTIKNISDSYQYPEIDSGNPITNLLDMLQLYFRFDFFHNDFTIDINFDPRLEPDEMMEIVQTLQSEVEAKYSVIEDVTIVSEIMKYV